MGGFRLFSRASAILGTAAAGKASVAAMAVQNLIKSLRETPRSERILPMDSSSIKYLHPGEKT
jgi:hypothetical protein